VRRRRHPGISHRDGDTRSRKGHAPFTGAGSNRIMSRTRTAMLAAASTVAAVSVTAVAATQFLKNQASLARKRIGKPLGEIAPDADRVWRSAYEGKPLELLVLGDSIAAGLGAERRKDVLGARVAKGLGRRARRPVRLRTAAVVGSESSALESQLDALPEKYRPDVAIIVVGGNDVTHRVPRHLAVEHLEKAIERLRARDAAVVVGTCPDLGALRPVPQPLRSVASRWSRQLASAQAEVAERMGAQVVSLRRTVGPMFLEQPEEMFSLDRFHPSALGYRRTAEALLPAVLAALGLETAALTRAA
jgi:lysophospholipase L1-like esterase